MHSSKINVTAHKLFFTNFIQLLPDYWAKKVEYNFFLSLKLRNGTTKTTASNRMTDLNKVTISYLKALNNKPKTFLDIAVSSGVSTGEWYSDLLNSGFKDLEIVGTDLTLDAYLIEVNKYFRILVQNCNFPLQYDIFGIPIRASKYGRRGYVNGVYLLVWFLKSIFNKISKKFQLDEYLYKANNTKPVGSDEYITVKNNKIRVKKLELISPSIKERNEIVFMSDDVGHENNYKLLKRFDVIRAANILNLGYFSEDVLIVFLKRLKERLKGAGSFFIICRTNNKGENNATLFKLNSSNEFEVVLRVGSGSEIEGIVLSLREPQMPAR